jgi:hypothetical protein
MSPRPEVRIAPAFQEADMRTTSAHFPRFPNDVFHATCRSQPRIPGAADAQHSVQLHDLPPHAQAEATAQSADPAIQEWTEEDVVLLHWRLLLELKRLVDPETPLEEKLDTLSWALTDPALDDRPFSFANCLRVVGTSPLSPTPYFGLLQVDEIREWLSRSARGWIRATISRYPGWVQELVRQQPDWVARQLARNPQWINEQVKARSETPQADLFAPASGMTCGEAR